jgi:hypothetical protein
VSAEAVARGGVEPLDRSGRHVVLLHGIECKRTREKP